MKYYKILGPFGYPVWGGSGYWYLPEDDKPGKWMPRIWFPRPCVRGYHLCSSLHIAEWLPWVVLDCEVWEAEWRGKIIMGEDKVVVSQARLVRKVGVFDRNARGEYNEMLLQEAGFKELVSVRLLDYFERRNK